jgi:predicted histone-like DNA-binding protein
MSVKYKLYQDKRATSKFKGMWYARSVVSDVCDTDQISERIQRNCSIKASDVNAVLTELLEVMHDELCASHRVVLKGIGAFKVGVRTSPAKTAKEFTASSNVKSFRVNFQPAVSINEAGVRTQALIAGIKVQEETDYHVDKTVPKP